MAKTRANEATKKAADSIKKTAENSEAMVKCDTLILDEISKSDTIPVNTLVIGGVVELNGVRLDGDASFTLKIHFIEQLRRHITQSDGFRLLQQAVGEGRFAVIDMSDYAKIPYLIF